MVRVGLDTQPSAGTYDLEDLVDLCWRGTVRIPHFQRDFRWGPKDVIRLFDSIVKGYPIGSLLLWVRHSPRQTVTIGKLDIDAPSTDQALWVVDGQQRLTSLANALHSKGNQHPPFDVWYDLADRTFVTNPSPNQPRYLPLPVLFDLEELLTWFAESGQVDSDYFTEARRVAKLIRQYKIPAYLVSQDNEEILTDIFDRLNNFGKRLKRAEIFSALFAGPEAGSGERLSIDKIAERVTAHTGFGTIDNDTILAAILARRRPDSFRDIRTEFDRDTGRNSDFPEEDQETAHALGERAIILAVEFLQREAGVPHIALLTYRALLIALTRFFALFPEPKDRNLILLRRLYWRASTSGPAIFKGAFTQMSRALCSKIRRGDEDGSVQALLGALAGAQPLVPDSTRFRTNEAGAKMILCSWWDLRPRSPLTGEPCEPDSLATSLEDQSSAAACVYRFRLRGLTPQQRLSPAGRLFVPDSEEPAEEYPSWFIDRNPGLDEAVWQEVLGSNCLTPRLTELLKEADHSTFLAERQDLITRVLHDFLARAAEWDFEDTPPLSSLDLDDLAEFDEPADDAA